MKRLVETTDRSLIEAIRLALDAEGIEAQILETGVSSLPFMPTVVRIVHDDDWDRAREVLQSLQAESPRPYRAPSSLRHARVALLALLSLVAILCLMLA